MSTFIQRERWRVMNAWKRNEISWADALRRLVGLGYAIDYAAHLLAKN